MCFGCRSVFLLVSFHYSVLNVTNRKKKKTEKINELINRLPTTTTTHCHIYYFQLQIQYRFIVWNGNATNSKYFCFFSFFVFVFAVYSSSTRLIEDDFGYFDGSRNNNGGTTTYKRFTIRIVSFSFVRMRDSAISLVTVWRSCEKRENVPIWRKRNVIWKW